MRYSDHGEKLKTTLGSCVSVILYPQKPEPLLQACSMSHYLLPEPSNTREKEKRPMRFGSYLLPQQIQGMRRRGLPPEKLLAKISGGASILSHRVKSIITDIGLLNVKLARDILRQHGIRITGENTGGEIGRSIEFDPASQKLRVHIFGSDPFFI